MIFIYDSSITYLSFVFNLNRVQNVNKIKCHLILLNKEEVIKIAFAYIDFDHNLCACNIA